MLLAHVALAAAAAAGLPAADLYAAGKAAAAALVKELGQGKLLLRQLAEDAAQDQPELQQGYPRTHLKLRQAMLDHGTALLSAAYVGLPDGSLHGVRTDSTGTALWVGRPPRDPALHCADERIRSTCAAPPGADKGSIETWRVSDDEPDAHGWALDNLEGNATYDPRTRDWYALDGEGRWSSTFVQRGGALPTLSITLSAPLPKGRGVAAVDLDLSGLDMILGPLRPAPGAELALADTRDDTIVGSTIPAGRLVRVFGKRLSAFEPPFKQVFLPVAKAFGGLKRTHRFGAVLLRADELVGAFLTWDSLLVHPIKDHGLQLVLIVTDDSGKREADAAARSCAGLLFAVAAATAAAVLGLS